MNKVDVDGFISSQRAKLAMEKSRLERCETLSEGYGLVHVLLFYIDLG